MMEVTLTAIHLAMEVHNKHVDSLKTWDKKFKHKLFKDLTVNLNRKKIYRFSIQKLMN